MSSDRLLGLACVALGAAMAWAAWGYAAPISYEPVGPRAFPLLLAAVLAGAGAWMALRPGPHVSGLATAPWRVLGPVIAAIFAYALLFEFLGFVLATLVMTVPLGRAFGGNWRQGLIAGLALGLGQYLLFDTLLDVVLPTGWLSFIFGGR
ncbi:tripartite tricarboxylate transporter TctB family protein [Ideonella livida]|uniref:Tripartite tricarboxylate transporter TctB family protein n=1 Tax=Ideonella livida TaxID=2707176 RepID=A0A7C9PEP5_9BURK|nr:tripartite tricarboxylate transporter TctB family protein [Ideonella livida]NDY90016.1 tripartite tricarboxylate transporter TctB family protein [Ideonella livida]